MFGIRSKREPRHKAEPPNDRIESSDLAGADMTEAMNGRAMQHLLSTEADRDAVLDAVFPPKGEVA